MRGMNSVPLFHVVVDGSSLAAPPPDLGPSGWRVRGRPSGLAWREFAASAIPSGCIRRSIRRASPVRSPASHLRRAHPDEHHATPRDMRAVERLERGADRVEL
jgi:hypothetical protein